MSVSSLSRFHGAASIEGRCDDLLRPEKHLAWAAAYAIVQSVTSGKMATKL